MLVKIKFRETRTVQDDNAETFLKGKTYTMEEASANHWIKRGAADRVDLPITESAELAGEEKAVRRRPRTKTRA